MKIQTISLITSLLLAIVVSSSAHADGTFAGYLCTQDCSGHEAGYEWADGHGITDPNDCGGNSQSFIEGCMAYANGLSPDEESDLDSGDNNNNADGDNNDDDGNDENED